MNLLAVATAKAGGGGGGGLLHSVTAPVKEGLFHDPIRGDCQNMKPLGKGVLVKMPLSESST